MILKAVDYLDAAGSIVNSGAMLADRALAALGAGQPVEITLAGMRGVSSSYFNILLKQLLDGVGLATFNQRVKFGFDSGVQEQMFRRSFESLTRNAA